MRTAILNCPLPVYAFVDNNAASAGALIAIACDSIYMRSSASMGAATVVNETGAAMPDKYQSYMRATMRATAEAHGKDSTGNWRRNPLIAEAMVDERIVVPHLCDSGKVLTLTASEAIAQRYCEGTVESVDELITQQLHRDRYTLEQFEPSLFDEIAGFLTNPALQAILVTLIFGGIFMELKTPGVGLPAAVACTAAVLYFAPLYLDGLAANWEILIFVVGVILLIFEIFVIPGFGIAGISGFTLIFAALVLALVGNVNFDFEFVPGREIGRGLITVSAGFIIYFVLLLLFFKKLTSKGPIGRLALNSAQDKDEGYIGVPPELQQYIGQTGEAATILRPSGKVVIDGTQFDAVALHGYIEQGATVRVVKYENAQLYVVEVK